MSVSRNASSKSMVLEKKMASCKNDHVFDHSARAMVDEEVEV
jgi:hypothetical protein